MRTVEGVPTSTLDGAVEYLLDYQEFESLSEAVDVIEGGEEGVLDIVNASQRQNALQTKKGDVLDAAKEHGPESEECANAIAEHQEHAATYIIGRPRGRRDGVTKTRAREFIDKVHEQYGEETLRELSEELGVEL